MTSPLGLSKNRVQLLLNGSVLFAYAYLVKNQIPCFKDYLCQSLKEGICTTGWIPRFKDWHRQSLKWGIGFPDSSIPCFKDSHCSGIPGFTKSFPVISPENIRLFPPMTLKQRFHFQGNFLFQGNFDPKMLFQGKKGTRKSKKFLKILRKSKEFLRNLLNILLAIFYLLLFIAHE